MALSKLDYEKLQFVVILGGIFFGTAVLVNGMDGLEGPLASAFRPVAVIVGVILMLAFSFKFGETLSKGTSEPKPKDRDVFDSTDRDTSGAVLGKLAEIRYGERKKRDRFENYYQIK